MSLSTSGSRARRLRNAATKRRLYESSQHLESSAHVKSYDASKIDVLIEHVQNLTLLLHPIVTYLPACADWNWITDTDWMARSAYHELAVPESIGAVQSDSTPRLDDKDWMARSAYHELAVPESNGAVQSDPTPRLDEKGVGSGEQTMFSAPCYSEQVIGSGERTMFASVSHQQSSQSSSKDKFTISSKDKFCVMEKAMKDKFTEGKKASLIEPAGVRWLETEPKRPESAYFIFMGEQTANCDGPITSAVRKMWFQKWESLSTSEDSRYSNLASKLQSMYEEQVSEFRSLGRHRVCARIEYRYPTA